jgi:ABC-type transport system involved in multi-copper enzyme maturation permease subunit
MTATISRGPQPRLQAGRGGFGSVLRAEWTKFRTVRGWSVALVVAALLTAGVGLWAAAGPTNLCGPTSPTAPAPAGPGGAGGGGQPCKNSIPTGPGGEAVDDSFYFAGQPLDGDGTVTAQVTSLTGSYSPDGGLAPGPDPEAGFVPGVQPWAKAGVIVKATLRPGSAYAAVMITGAHGVRMQDDYTSDTAGLPGAVSAGTPRWLRLNRSGDTLTGYDSADGRHWTEIGAVSLAGLPATVQAGLFVTSPARVSGQGADQNAAPSAASAVFTHVSLAGARSGRTWSGANVGPGNGGSGYPSVTGEFHQAGGTFTITGSGDIAPALPGGVLIPGETLAYTLNGVFAGLIVAIVLGTLFITGEYRRGLIRTTLAASPRRGQVLAAKAIVIGGAMFAAGLVGTVIPVSLGPRLLREHGNYVFPVDALTEIRLIAGSAALLAVAAVFAVALGAILRHGAGPVTAVIALIVVPFFFSSALAVLPASAAEWLLRVTPAAGFAIQQSVPAYGQVSYPYTPEYGFYPLAPWAGFAVLCAWTAAAMALAYVLLRRRDA